MHLEYKNDHTYFVPFTTPLLYFSTIWNSQTKTKYSHFRNFDWLTKITHIVDGGVYLKRPKRFFKFLFLFYPSKMEISTISMIYGFWKAT